MILSLTRYTTRLALRVRNLVDYGQLTDWRQLQLVISAGEYNKKCCHVGGSPWILTGCWPFHPTNVDVANPQPYDFPAIVLDAFDTDDQGRVVFRLDKRVHQLPNGRYTGLLRLHKHKLPINLEPLVQLHTANPPTAEVGAGAAITYKVGCKELCNALPPSAPHREKECCILAQFDIDMGPECAQHIVDQCTVEFKRTTCGELCGEEQ